MSNISYEEELEISDHFFSFRKLKEKKDIENIDFLTQEEKEIIRQCEKSVSKLIEAYLPFAYARAWDAWNKYCRGKPTQIELEDARQIAVIAMLSIVRSFDARGLSRENPEGRKGLRFASYSRMHVDRELKRKISLTDSPVYMSAKKIECSRIFFYVCKKLSEENPSMPFAEIKEKALEAAGGDKKQIIDDFFVSSSFENLLELGDFSESGAIDKDLDNIDDQSFDSSFLGCLQNALSSDESKLFSEWTGINQVDLPEIKILAKQKNKTKKQLMQELTIISEKIKHPSKVQFFTSLKE